MVGLRGVGCDHDEDAADCEEVVDNSPPRVGGEAISGLDLGDDRCDEGNYPGELRPRQQHGPSKIDSWGRRNGMQDARAERLGWAGLDGGPNGAIACLPLRWRW